MTIATSLQGLDNFIAYLAAALLAEALFLFLYTLITPHREWPLIKEGNKAAAIGLGGAMIGFTLPLASAIAHSVSFVDMAIWAAVAVVVQIIVFALLSLALRGLAQRIKEGNVAVGIASAATSIAVGMLNAASLTY